MTKSNILTSPFYKKAKKDFDSAFNNYAMIMYKYEGVVHEMPDLYFSEELAKQNLPQPQTEFYLKEAERLKRTYNE
jgi:hypothetical protein